MKLLNCLILFTFFTSTLCAFQEHNSGLSYAHPNIAVKDGVTYITVQDVPTGTEITNTNYWAPLLDTAPTEADEPGDPPSTDTSTLAEQLTGEGNNTTYAPPPEFTSSSSPVSFVENSTDVVYTAEALNTDSFSISGDDSSLFVINVTTGVITFASAPDYENPTDQNTDNNYSLTITASNTAGNSVGLELTIVVTDDISDNATLSGGRLVNLSTRGYVGTGVQRLIGGFRVYGGQLDVLVRGFGPSRNNDDNLDDPILTWKTNPASLLPDSSGIVAEVDNADDNARLSGANSTAQELLDVLVDKETADIQTVSNWDNNLSRGYTAYITNVDGTDEGIGRIGINDLSDQTGDGQLVNISTRGYVGTDSTEFLIAGFQIRGGSVKVCIRAFGPSRTNSDALSDPQVELIQQKSDYHTEKVTLAWNDDYDVDYDDGTIQTANSSAEIPDYLNTLISKESAIVITLPTGNYTARVSGVGGVDGIGRVGIDKVIE